MRHLAILTFFLCLGGSLFGQDFVAKLDKKDSLIIKEIKRYKIAVSFFIKNNRLITKEFLKSGDMLEVNRNLIDSLANRNSQFKKIKMLFLDSLLLNNESAINIWLEKNEKVIYFYVRERKAVRFKKEINSVCVLKYRDSSIPEKSNWSDGNEKVSFRIDKNWKYTIRAK